jgi:hypothetical protein
MLPGSLSEQSCLYSTKSVEKTEERNIKETFCKVLTQKFAGNTVYKKTCF